MLCYLNHLNIPLMYTKVSLDRNHIEKEGALAIYIDLKSINDIHGELFPKRESLRNNKIIIFSFFVCLIQIPFNI